MEMTKVFVIIVTYNGKQWYDRCFSSLRNSEIPVQIVVVDNASSDDTVEYIRTNFPEVHLIESAVNLGFGKGNNIGIRYALDIGSDYIFLLNQDAWIEKNTLSKLIDGFKNKNVGIVSPIHLNGSYTGLDLDFALYMSAKFISDSYLRNMEDYYFVPMVNAAAWLISAECIQTVGGFDTLLFAHYGEDDNYCQRVLYHGFKIAVCTKSTICHDREFREDLSLQSSFGIDKDERYRKILLGDINRDSKIPQMIEEYKRKIKRNKLFGRFTRNINIKKDIDFLQVIEDSRNINIKKGLNWL